MLSIPHMIVVFVVVLVVFGPKKLPELARGLGKLMAEFRKASTDFKSAFEEEMRNVERQAREADCERELWRQARPRKRSSPGRSLLPQTARLLPTRVPLLLPQAKLRSSRLWLSP